jgi:aryl-alcohol dehydrogenase-like predicted oxidoreductase
MDFRSKLILGTANFGNVYGIANNGKSLSLEDAKSLINWAQIKGINHFDTAPAYGDAESILGINLNHTLNPVIDTKLDVKDCKSRKSILEATRRSMQNLRVKQISTLYLHDESLLQNSNAQEIVAGFADVLYLGLAKQIGVSVYSEAAVIACKNVLPELTVFQVPENICDRRLISSKRIKDLANNGNIFFVRSVFLQGLLLMDVDSIPSNLNAAKASIRKLKAFAGANSLTVMELCLAYVNSITWASGILVGAASPNQFREAIGYSSPLPDGWRTAIETLSDEIIDPRKWT